MKPFLIDGPLMLAVERRKAVLERMAKDLSRLDAFLCDDDARRALRREGYPGLDVDLLHKEARMIAMQDVVAREMAKP